MKIVISNNYQETKDEILKLIKNFNRKGIHINDGKRNSIKVFDLNGKKVNIKSFKLPNAVNKIVYRFFRKSKAERSFSYAEYLISKNIGTPHPIAFVEKKSAFTFQDSFYISEHLEYDLTFRELVNDANYPKREEILRAFTRFTYELHEKKIEFLDHSPGNTLIQLHNENYKFFLVDLNRMNFKNLNFEERMRNFSRLTPKKEMVEVMSNEYASLINKPEAEVFEEMWMYTTDFQKKFKRKKELKKKLKFWKN